jgi:hypothetical protein
MGCVPSLEMKKAPRWNLVQCEVKESKIKKRLSESSRGDISKTRAMASAVNVSRITAILAHN